MVKPVGPMFAGGNQLITKSGYRINYWADAHNLELQRLGLAPSYYWLPEGVRLVRRPNGNLSFSYIHFVGVRNEDTNVGVTGTEEVAGATITLNTIAAPPDNVLAEAQEALLEQVRGTTSPLFHWNGAKKPNFSFVPIVSNDCVLSNSLPGTDGSIPSPAAPPRGKALDPHAPRDLVSQSPSRALIDGRMPLTVPMRGVSRSNIDPMLIRMNGQGPGPINPHAAKAYGALLGSVPAAVAYASFHDTGTGSLFVTQNMKVRVVSPLMTIDIVGRWSDVHNFYSGALSAGGWFWDADIKATFENMRKQGVITVNTFIDETLPNAKELREQIDKKATLVYEKFSEMAKKAIFDPVPFNELPAEAKHGSGFLGGIFGGAAAFKLRKQSTEVNLEYHETSEFAYMQDYQVNGTLDEVADDIRADPAKDKVYFTKVDLGDWDRKVMRVAKPVINWPDPDTKWVGEPVAFVDVQFGYPNEEGALQWHGHVFNQGDGPTAQWSTAVAMKKADEVKNPPPGWKPDKLFMKRKIHFTEPPSPLENPYARIQVEVDEIDLDPGEFGTLDDTINVAVRADSAGTLAVGPINLGANLTDDSQVVEVTMRALGKRRDGKQREPVKFTFKAADQNEPRFWMVYTGQPDFEQKWEYSVRVIVKGSLFDDGMEWELNQFIQTGGSGGITIRVPKPNSPEVTKRSVPLSAFRRAIGEDTTDRPPPATPDRPEPEPIHAPPPSTGHTPPPSTPKPASQVPSGVSAKPSAPPPATRGGPGQKRPSAQKAKGYGREADTEQESARGNGTGGVVFTSLSPSTER